MSDNGRCNKTEMCSHLGRCVGSAQWDKKVVGKLFRQEMVNIKTDERYYMVYMHLGGKDQIVIRYCPFCGSKPGVAHDLPDYGAEPPAKPEEPAPKEPFKLSAKSRK